MRPTNWSAFADIHGALYQRKRLRVPKLLDWVYGEHKPLPEFPEAGENGHQRNFFQPAEIVIPAAVENQITSENAHRLQTRILCERRKRALHCDGGRDRRPQR